MLGAQHVLLYYISCGVRVVVSSGMVIDAGDQAERKSDLGVRRALQN
jgi:hypothetical protein